MTKLTRDLRMRGDADPRPGNGTYAEHQERKAERTERKRKRDDLVKRAANARKNPSTAAQAQLTAMREKEMNEAATSRKVAARVAGRARARKAAPLGPDDGTPEWRARWSALGKVEAKAHREKRRPVSVRMGGDTLEAINAALFAARTRNGGVLYLRSDFIMAAVLALLGDEPANIDHWLKKAPPV